MEKHCIHKIEPVKKITLINVEFLSGNLKGKAVSDLTAQELEIALNSMGDNQKKLTP